jgi:hypothetical protein
MVCPKLQASSLYYKMKLSCHNFIIYDLASGEVENYLWHEGEGELCTSGKRKRKYGLTAHRHRKVI